MTSDRPLFGSLALCKGLCTLEELDVALDAQKSSDPRIPLGQVLVDMGKLTAEQVQSLVALQGVSPAVARLVQEAGPALEKRVVAPGEDARPFDLPERLIALYARNPDVLNYPPRAGELQAALMEMRHGCGGR